MNQFAPNPSPLNSPGINAMNMNNEYRTPNNMGLQHAAYMHTGEGRQLGILPQPRLQISKGGVGGRRASLLMSEHSTQRRNSMDATRAHMGGGGGGGGYTMPPPPPMMHMPPHGYGANTGFPRC